MRFYWSRRFVAQVGAIVMTLAIGHATSAAETSSDKKTGEVAKFPLLLDENFSSGAARWTPASPEGWKIIDIDGGKAFSEFKNINIEKKLPHRSPWNIALLNDINVGDFVLEVKVRETAREYPHRDSCLVFGYQDPAHMYYVHFASTKNDPHANQVFIVNAADRLKISEKEAEPVKWGGQTDWHRLKIVRHVADGLIEAYFDDMEKPIEVAHDKTFTWGRIGMGTFDDTADFAEVKLWGNKVKPGAREGLDEPKMAETAK
jgi:hypothetical protein